MWTRIAQMILAASLLLATVGCQQPEGSGEPTPPPREAYVYPGEELTMDWANPAFSKEEYAEGAELFTWVNSTKDAQREYSYTGTVHWIENQGNHIFSLLCLPEEYDGSQKYPLLLMVHGFNSTCHEYDYFVNFLTQAGYAVLLFDFRGGHESAGLSDGKLIQMSYDTKLSDIRAVTAFAETLPMADQDNFIFIGHSQGGLMGVITACTEGLKDRFNGMLLLAPAVGTMDLEALDAMEELPKTYTVLYCKVGRDYLYSVLKHEKTMWDEVKEYGHPVKILCGTSDELFSQEDMEFAVEAFGENATMEMVEGGYHDFRDDVLPKIMPETILPFLNSLKK